MAALRLRRLRDVGVNAHRAALTAAAHLAVKTAAKCAGSQIGGIAETQEMLDFCAEQRHPQVK